MFLQETDNNQALLEGFAAKNPDVKEFLYYFVNSSLVHYHVLSDFRKFFNAEEKSIKDDIKKKLSVRIGGRQILSPDPPESPPDLQAPFSF